MKKTIAICFILMVILILCPAEVFAAEGDTGTDGYFSWRELADGTVEVTDYSYAGPNDVVIPGTLSGRTVSAIGQAAFQSDGISSVALPDSVTTIGNSAFVWCSYLTSVSLGSGLKSIGNDAFYSSGVTSLTLPDSLETIGDTAFLDCRDLASVTFGSGLKSIGSGAFIDCIFSSAVLPDSLESIGSYAFYGTSLTSVTFGSHLDSIGDGAFAQCPINVPLLFPDSLQTIGVGTFLECTGLTAVTFGSGLVSIGESAFYGTGIVSAALPDSLITIGVSAFGHCASLTAVTFGSGLESIGEGAFISAPLEEAVLPDSLKTIGDSAFYECTSLTAVTFGNGLESIGQWAFSHSGLTSVTLPASLQTLDSWAFYQCTSLDKVVILSRTASMHGGAFLGCPLGDGIWGFAGSTAQSTFRYYPFHYLYAVSFDTAGGSAVDDAVVEEGGMVSQPAEPSWEAHIFGGWYTDADCTQAAAFPFIPSADTTLYAKWTELTLSSSDADGIIYTGGRVTLTPNVDGGEWDWDEAYFSATFNSPATFTALKAGASTITYTVGGVSVTYDVTIEQSGLPSTGQDFAGVWLLFGAALALAGAGIFAWRRRKRVSE